MSRRRFYTADVFTTHLFGGNPLAVFPHAEGLDAPRLQQIARELSLSETAFVFPPEQPHHARRLRIFTPAMELPFAGHPTIGAAAVLAAVGEIAVAGDGTEIVFEEAVGPVRVVLRPDGARPPAATLWAAQLPEAGPTPPPGDVAALVGLNPSDLADPERFPRAASCGVPFLLVAVRDRAALGRVLLDRARWDTLLARAWAPHVFCFTTDPELPGSQLRARMFAPAMGIAEDPATGAAATALAGHLAATDPTPDGTLRWVIEQGFEMGRPSLLETEVDKRGGAVVAVRVGGSTVLVSDGTMEVGD